MDNISIENQNGQLVVDSRLVAERLGIQHKNFLESIRKYQAKIEQRFGQLAFETETVKNSVGAVNEVKFCYLTEDHATALMTFSRNTDAVVDCKLDLVEAFSKARDLLAQKHQPLQAYTRRVMEIETSVIGLPKGYWCVIKEAKDLLIYVERCLGYQIQEYDLLDGSIGACWSKYRKDKPWSGQQKHFVYQFRDKRGNQSPNCYPNSELFEFRDWLETVYKPNYLNAYLLRKYSKLIKL